MTSRLLTNSCMGEWQQCPRKYRNRYVLGYVPHRTPEALVFGTATHGCLEVYWLARKANARDPLGAALAAVPADLDAYAAARLRVMLHAYAAVWDRTRCRVLAVEAAFEVPLLDPETGTPSVFWRRSGKIDLLLQDRGGAIVLVEHKCLAGSALIFDHATGRYERADQLFARGAAPVVTALDADAGFVIAAARPLREATVRPIFCVTTLGGRALRVSGNHPVLTPRGWVAAEDLTEGDWVATPKHLASPSTPETPLSDEAIRLVGYMIGDGALSGMCFTKTDPAVLQDVLRCARALGEEATIRKPPSRSTPYIKFSACKAVARLMGLAGFTNRTLSADKRLPLGLAFSDRQLGQLLGALWSTDGCVDTFRGRKPRIIYTSVSRELCQDVQHALQRLGVVANVRTTSVAYKGKRRAVSTAQVVSREAKRRFLMLVRSGVIPVLRTHTSVEAMEACLDALRDNDGCLQPQADASIWWDRVEAVEAQPAEMTYDVEVPGPHTFVVDGVVTHNTSGEDVGPGSDYNRRLLLDAQISTYKDGALSLGYRVDRILYDVLKKPNERPLLATPADKLTYTKPTKKHPEPRLHKGQRLVDETIEQYEDRMVQAVIANPSDHVVRTVVHRFQGEMDDFREDVWLQAKKMRRAIEDDEFERYTKNCFRFGKPCDYLAVCEKREALENPMVFARLRDVHPELGRAPGAETG